MYPGDQVGVTDDCFSGGGDSSLIFDGGVFSGTFWIDCEGSAEAGGSCFVPGCSGSSLSTW